MTGTARVSRLTVSEWERDGQSFHSYKLDGLWVPGVTSVARLGSGSSDGLVNWAANLTAAYAYDARDRLEALTRDEWLAVAKAEGARLRSAAADKGKQIHDLAFRAVRGAEVDVPSELLGYVTQTIDFWERWDVEPVLAERPVYSQRYAYAGRLDLVAKLRDGRVWLLDYKTGSVWPTVCLQLAAYRYAEAYVDENGEDQEMPEVDECAVVQIREDGWDLIPVAAGVTMFGHFCTARKLFGFTKFKRDDLVGPAMDRPETAYAVDATARELI